MKLILVKHPASWWVSTAMTDPNPVDHSTVIGTHSSIFNIHVAAPRWFPATTDNAVVFFQ